MPFPVRKRQKARGCFVATSFGALLCAIRLSTNSGPETLQITLKEELSCQIPCTIANSDATPGAHSL
jgi:hypothetical protein